MNEFLPRIEPVASVVSATERVTASVKAVQPVSQTASRTDASTGSATARQDASEQTGGVTRVSDDQAEAAADYARVQAKVASVLADLAAQSNSSSTNALGDAEQALLSLMPQPMVLLPQPPTSQQMIEFAAQVSLSIARQAALARAAQSNVSAGTVDAAIG
jgi:hypothetical protein